MSLRLCKCPQAFSNYLIATQPALQKLPRRACVHLPASNRQNSTSSLGHEKGSLTSSSSPPASSDDPGQRPHLRSAGLSPPMGVTIAGPPRNVLPERPDAPKYPCPHLTDKQVEEYLFPLYERNWGIYTKLPTDGKPASLMLAKHVSFAWHFPLVDFLQQLHIISKEEGHHPRVTYEFRVIDISTQTHSATVGLPDGSLSGLHEDRVPGITLRDVRLAYLIEDALMSFYDLGKVAQSSPKYGQLKSLHIPGLSSQDAKESPKSKCVVCGGPHWATTCPHRFTMKPSNACELCGGDHWKFACPQYKLWRLSVKKGWNKKTAGKKPIA